MIEDLHDVLNNFNKYKIHEFLYKIDGDDFNEIVSFTLESKHSKKFSNHKDFLRNQIKKGLELDRLDSIFFTDNTIYVKLFIHLEDKSEGERRACGMMNS
jgi:hypothetical protein